MPYSGIDVPRLIADSRSLRSDVWKLNAKRLELTRMPLNAPCIISPCFKPFSITMYVCRETARVYLLHWAVFTQAIPH